MRRSFIDEEGNLHIEKVLDIIIDNAKMQCEMSGKIKGPKEVLGYIDPGRARNFAVDYWKAK